MAQAGLLSEGAIFDISRDTVPLRATITEQARHELRRPTLCFPDSAGRKCGSDAAKSAKVRCAGPYLHPAGRPARLREGWGEEQSGQKIAACLTPPDFMTTVAMEITHVFANTRPQNISGG